MLRVITCITQQHDLRLVALSAVICALGCFAMTTMMAQAEIAPGRRAARWIGAAAAVFGCSVWALHFVAMIAFNPSSGIAYETHLTAFSVAVAVAGTWAALLLWRHSRAPVAVVCAGVVLGLAIGGMHYLGVGAMRSSSVIAFDPVFAAASVGIGVSLALVALARANRLLSLTRRLEVTGWLALAVGGLHFTGMAATTVTVMAPSESAVQVLGSATLAMAVGLVSLAILIACLVTVLLQQYLAERASRELDRMRLLGNLAHEVLLIYRDGSVIEVNDAGSRLFGKPVQALIGLPVLGFFSEFDEAALLRRTRCPPEDRRPEEFSAVTADGGLVPVELSCRPIEFDGKPATAVALRDLTNRKRDEALIQRLALHDALTDLPNRHLLKQRVNDALDAAAQTRTGVAVAYLDLDRFKSVNDLHGHAVGDALLAQVARRMMAELRPADTLARVGGDEFVAVLTAIRSPEHASEIATRLIGSLCQPFAIEGRRIEVGASAGVALYPGDGGTAETLLRAADTALYRVKDEGRGAVRFFEAAMDIQLQARRKLEAELGSAVERDELQLFYQPIVNGATGEIETFEALIRWRHPERGLVSPGEFIPLAEQSDLIARIGEWVIETACAAAASWSRRWRVSVNVSPSQFRRSDMAAVVSAALARHDLDPGRLVIEITESVFIQDTVKAVETLTRLRSLGVRLALDDFGTGYSSLSYLQQFRFDEFKIDQSFVRRIGQHADTLTIVGAIANLGRNLGLQVTVEGVETAEQLAILRRLGCDQMQGYLFARPAPKPATSELEQARLRALFATAAPRAA